MIVIRHWPLLLLAITSLALSPRSGSALTINNGLAPPEPENVISSFVALPPFTPILINNAGCFKTDVCLGVQALTAVELVPGGFIPPFAVQVHGTSRFDMSGGLIGIPTSGTGSIAYKDHSVGTISGGFANVNIIADDSSTVTITGGVIVGEVLTRLLSRNPAHFRAEIRVEGGEVGGLRAEGSGFIRMSGGLNRGPVFVWDDGVIEISGGEFRPDSGLTQMTANGHAMIQIIGDGFELDGVPLFYGRVPARLQRSTLRGVLASGDDFEVEIYRQRYRNPQAYPGIFVLPEPRALPDFDRDGIIDRRDFCPFVPDALNLDTDIDNIGDACNDSEDRDGDEHADDRDVCPDLPNPEQRDTNANGIGDACNDEFDMDGDEFEDDVDTCPDLASPLQFDGDEDGIGDICDPFPDDSVNIGAINELLNARSEILSLVIQRDEATDALFQCLAKPSFLDEDADGEHDRTDACSGTGPNQAVDAAGCSRSQFCNAIQVPGPKMGWLCQRADWRNDDLSQRPLDCRVAFEDKESTCVACLEGDWSCRGSWYDWWRSKRPRK